MPALTAFLTNTNDTLVTTARQLTNSAPSSETSVTIPGVQRTGTGWIEFWSQGGTQSSYSGSEPTPTGKGFIWDVTTLEGQQIAAGNWTVKVKLSNGSSTPPTGDIVARAYVRSSGGVYTQIGSDMTLASQTLTGSLTVYTIGPVSQAASPTFNTGDKLYVDVLWHETTDLGLLGTMTFNFSENGGANEEFVTPGYGAPLVPLIEEACYVFPFQGIRDSIAY